MGTQTVLKDSGEVLASWLLLSTDAGREPTAAMEDHRHPEPAKPQKPPDQNASGMAPWPRAYGAAQGQLGLLSPAQWVFTPEKPPNTWLRQQGTSRDSRTGPKCTVAAGRSEASSQVTRWKLHHL